MAENDIIKQDNSLTMRKYDLSPLEQNTVYCIIRQIQHDYPEGSVTDGNYPEFHVWIDDKVFEKIADYNHKEQARAALKRLRNRPISIDYEDGSWLEVGFINSAKYDRKHNAYNVAVSGDIMPYYVDLAEKFTAYSLSVAISLKSVYSKRFYELCNQWKHKGKFFIKVADLKRMLSAEDKYRDIPAFEKWCIDVAQKELHEKFSEGKCDIWFDWNVKINPRTGKPFRGKEKIYMFLIHTAEQTAEQREQFKELRSKSMWVYKTLMKFFPKDKNYPERVLKAMDLHPEFIDDMMEHLQRFTSNPNNSRGDVAALCRMTFEEDFNIPRAGVKTQQQQERLKKMQEHQKERYEKSGDKNTSSIGDVLQQGSPRSNGGKVYRNHYETKPKKK